MSTSVLSKNSNSSYLALSCSHPSSHKNSAVGPSKQERFLNDRLVLTRESIPKQRTTSSNCPQLNIQNVSEQTLLHTFSVI